jgi:tetratricopeptide (TPR) repeat protein
VKLENERIRIADEALESLKRSAADMPTLVFLEDLHWADESSLFVLNYLARNVRDSQIFLLGTFRPLESDALRQIIDNMKAEEIVDELALEKLDAGNTANIVDGIFSPNDFPSTLKERLYEQSKGNPLFVTEMLRGMHDDGSIADKDGKYILVSETFSIPTTVEEVVNRRLDSLDPDSMAMVEYASCIGQSFDVLIAASNRMVSEPKASLEKLLSAGILLRRNGTIEFSHAVFRSVIYNGIGERWKLGHHKSIGECLEGAYANRIDDIVYELARHFSRTREHRKCTDYCIRAGEKAEGSFAVEQALEFYNWALDALNRLGSGHSHARVLDILERAGDIQIIMADYDGAIGKFLRVRESSADNETAARMLRKGAIVHEKKGEFDKSLKMLAEAKELIEEKGSAEYARLLLCEGTVHFGMGEYELAMPLFREAIAHFGHVASDRRDMGNALRAVGNIHLNKGEYALALEHYEKSLAVMENADDKDGIASALNNMGIVHCNRGEFEKGLELYSRSLEIQEKIGDRQGIALSLNNIGIIYHVKGQLDKVLEFYGRSLEMRERMGDRRGIAHTLTNMGSVHHECGELDKALLFYGRSLEIGEKIGDKRGVAGSLYYTGSVHQDRGESERALELFKRGLDMYLEMGDERNAIYNYCRMAEEYLELGNDSASLEYAEKAIITASRMGAGFEEGIIRVVLGAIHRGRDDLERAGEELERARAILEGAEEKNMKELARLQYETGLLWKAKGEPERARELLEKALADFEGMHMKLWAEKCRKALEELEP